MNNGDIPDSFRGVLKPLMEKFGPEIAKRMQDPKFKECLEAATLLVLEGLLAPWRLRKAASVIQRFRQGEAITYRDGRALIAAIGDVAQVAVVASRQVERRLDPLYALQDSRKDDPRS